MLNLAKATKEQFMRAMPLTVIEMVDSTGGDFKSIRFDSPLGIVELRQSNYSDFTVFMEKPKEMKTIYELSTDNVLLRNDDLDALKTMCDSLDLSHNLIQETQVEA